MGFPLLLNGALGGVNKHGWDVCTRWTLCGHVQSGQVSLPLLLNIRCNFANSKVGTKSLEVLLSMFYVVWRNHDHLGFYRGLKFLKYPIFINFTP